MFDISKVTLAENSRNGLWHEVMLPNGLPAGFRWKVRGMDSEQVLAAYKAHGELDPTDMDALNKLAVDVVFAATVDIEGLTDAGEPVTPENCKPVLDEHKGWLAAQLMEVISDRMKFFSEDL